MGEEGAADSRGAGAAADAGGISGSCAPGWGLRCMSASDLRAPGASFRRREPPGGGKGRIEDGVRGFDGKVRAKTVDRRRWYELPEEVDGRP